MQSNETPFETNYRLQIRFNFHVHHQIVLQVAANVAKNESFVLSKVTPASKVPPFDGTKGVDRNISAEQNHKENHTTFSFGAWMYN